MIRLILFFVLLALVAWGGVYLVEHPGHIELSWFGFVVQTSAALLVIAVAGAGDPRLDHPARGRRPCPISSPIRRGAAAARRATRPSRAVWSPCTPAMPAPPAGPAPGRRNS